MSRIKRKESEFAAQLSTFLSNWQASFLTAAGWTAVDFAAFSGSVQTFDENRTDAANLRAQAKSAVATKDATEKALRASFQRAVDKLYATPTITDANLTALGLPPRSGVPASVIPNPATGLVAEPSAAGTCELAWKRNGNPRTTLFLIQASADGNTWVQIGQTLRTRFKDIAATPGMFKIYRVIASNARGQATPSNLAAIYGATESVELELAA